MADLPVSPALFFDTVTAYQRAEAVKAAVELRLFTGIAAGKNTAADLAAWVRASERGIRILADFLVVAGFLTKSAGRYGLTPDSAMFLDEKSPAYAGGAVEFLAAPHLKGHFAALVDRVRAGGAPETRDSVLAPGHESWVRFARGMAGLQGMAAAAVAQAVITSTQDPVKVLDIAAGHGMFGIAVLQKNKKARVVGQDWANVLEVAREHAARFGVLDRYETLPGSAFEVDLGKDYDVVLVTHFLHHFDRPTNIAFLKRAHAALKPAGQLAILEFVPNDDRVTPPGAAGFSLVMLATTPAGDAYTFKELESMLKDAGFGNPESHDVPGMPAQIVTARKK